jgi:hypothetical protein
MTIPGTPIGWLLPGRHEMRAIVTKEFLGRPDGKPLARRILVGEEITGDLAEVAHVLKFATPVDEMAHEAPAKAVMPKRGRK